VKVLIVTLSYHKSYIYEYYVVYNKQSNLFKFIDYTYINN